VQRQWSGFLASNRTEAPAAEQVHGDDAICGMMQLCR
jgi:hypothetical protein